VRRERIRHTGSIKYDSAGLEERTEISNIRMFHLNAIDPPRLVLFGGSTHAGEEELLARAFINLRRKFPALCLFIAPRHVERVREIRKQLENLSLEVRLSSEAETRADSKPDCVLLDKTGELQLWYGIATVVFMGKSLTARGGQNPVEPIVAGIPVIFGPHMENFARLAESLIAKNGAIQVRNAGELETAAGRLLRDPEARRLLVENAQQVLTEHRGATARTARLVVDPV
jgi:3-deoxy-D-manno-octulosonic-acid transferase